MTVPYEVPDADIWVGATAPTGPEVAADDFWFDTSTVPFTGIDIDFVIDYPGPPTGPTGPSMGDIILDGDGIIWVWDGADWVEVGPITGPSGPTGPAGPASTVIGPTGATGPIGPPGGTGAGVGLSSGLGTRVVDTGVGQRVDVAHDESLEILSATGPEYLLSVSEAWLANQVTAGQVAAGPGLTGPTGSPPALAVHPFPNGGILVGPSGVAIDPNWVTNQTLAGMGLISIPTGAQTRTIDVGPGEGIVVDPDAVRVDQAWLGDFVNQVIHGALAHASVDLATTAQINLAVAPTEIDGHPPFAGQRVLVKDQSLAAENGIYALGPSGTLERALDADGDGELANGSFVTVLGGATQANTSWQATITDQDFDGWTVNFDGNEWSARSTETRREILINAPTPPTGTIVTHGLGQQFVHVSIFDPDGNAVGAKVQCVNANDVNIVITDPTVPQYTVICSL